MEWAQQTNKRTNIRFCENAMKAHLMVLTEHRPKHCIWSAKINLKARGVDYDWHFVYLFRQRNYSFLYVNYATKTPSYPTSRYLHFDYRFDCWAACRTYIKSFHGRPSACPLAHAHTQTTPFILYHFIFVENK